MNRLNEDSRGDNWFEHPDGHPDAGELGIPEHYGNGHVHSVSPKGEKSIFTW